jgi:hypothetical protein
MLDSLNILTSFAAVDFTFKLAVKFGLLKPDELSLNVADGDFFNCLMNMFKDARNITGSIDAFENNVLKRVREILSNPAKHNFSVTTIVDGSASHITRNPNRIVLQEANTNSIELNAQNNNLKLPAIKTPSYSTRFFLTKAEIQIIFNAPTEILYKRVMDVLIKYKVCQNTASTRIRAQTKEGTSSRKRFHEFCYPEEEEDNAETSQLEMDL